ncbi:MAG: GTP-binding protein [Gemmatimonadetes bacterium]|nr:GTP-binding protein [Gemmatimonadota bacterium]
MRHRRPRPAARHRAPAPEERSLTESRPRFLGSFPRADAVLDPPLPEIAFVGRSNVGKSSLLNALLGRRIAKVSGTPGKTRMMNVYDVSEDWGVGSGVRKQHPAHSRRPIHHTLYFLDLPGYGYARAGKTERAAFRRVVAHALERERLAGVVWLLDIRHEASADDRAMQDVLAESGTGVLAALTKSDKLPRGQRLRRARELRATLALDEDQVVVTSARTGEGIPELQAAIEALVKEVAR